ncbi:hypothetical protein SAMN05428642_102748 [Flaviramulus basaltis]|uniref:Uncharacterized protein n=1 Tax=Flaviramulus basaltis TaxID=369401 RepID=A0A1K2IJ75_9FLAO|nr:hypothetical protein [Flaviramulus basaltis]SFZ92476.1 hypothetical protein SAMN05428642_102748 [Flaviramulus basaltis]
MLNNKQSLILSGIMAGSVFVFGIIDLLDNFVVLTVLTLIFFTIIINLFYVSSKQKEDKQEQDDLK